MDIQDALRNMELDKGGLCGLTSQNVKRQYRKMALKLHPDKNGNTPESTKRFQELTESYNILIKLVEDTPTDNDDIFTTFSSTPSGYFEVLKQFIKSTFENMPDEYISEKIKLILENCQDISVNLFENIDRDTSLTIFQFLSTYREILHIQDDTLQRVKTIIQNKFEELEIYTIEPSIHDLLADNVYRLKIEGEEFLVPLWHKEMYFDMKNGKELLVLCQPLLPDGWWIDDSNNLHGVCNVPFTKQLLDCIILPIYIDNNKHVLSVPMQMLSFEREQKIYLKGKGMLRINENNMYDSENRRDLTVTIKFT